MDSGKLLTIYFALTQIFSDGKAKIYLHTMLQLTVFMPISCPMRSRRHLVFMNVVTSRFARHSLNARKVINWERNFKENIIKQELSHDSIARLNCALPITKTISVIR